MDPLRPDRALLAKAATVIRRGGLVAFPTETVYGLGANAFDEAAVGRVFAAKERAADDPLIVHLRDIAELPRVTSGVPALARRLAEVHWPGPLTLVLPKSGAIPANVTAGLQSVAVRVPAHAVARGLIGAAGVPVAAPSANRFTRTSATTAAHVLEDLAGRVDLVLDGGATEAGIESTVVEVDDETVRLLRPGALTLEAIQQTLRDAGVGAEVLLGGRQKASPGMMERHYAPRARLVYVRGPLAATLIRERIVCEAEAGRRAGVLGNDDQLAGLSATDALRASLGPAGDVATAARRLFAALRELDRQGAEVVFALGPAARDGLGRAVDDRLRRAAAEVLDS